MKANSYGYGTARQGIFGFFEVGDTQRFGGCLRWKHRREGAKRGRAELNQWLAFFGRLGNGGGA